MKLSALPRLISVVGYLGSMAIFAPLAVNAQSDTDNVSEQQKEDDSDYYAEEMNSVLPF